MGIPPPGNHLALKSRGLLHQFDRNGEQVGLLPRVGDGSLDVGIGVDAHVELPPAEIIALRHHLLARRPRRRRRRRPAAGEYVGERNGEWPAYVQRPGVNVIKLLTSSFAKRQNKACLSLSKFGQILEQGILKGEVSLYH